MQDLSTYVQDLGRNARRASQQLVTLDGATKVRALKCIADALRANQPLLLEANAKDIEAAEAARLDPPLVDRLRLDAKKVAAMADGVEQIAAQTDPVGQTLEGYVRPNGLRIEKRRVPLGVVLFFYESRPNVTSDAAALCLKSGNAVILRGGKEAFHSNKAIVDIIRTALASARESSGSAAGPSSLEHAVQLVESTD